MIVFELKDGSQYTARVVNYDIEVKNDRLEVFIITDRGAVWYEILKTGADKNLLFMRDCITKRLGGESCNIAENAETSRVCFEKDVFDGYRVKSEFFPRPEDKQRP